MTNPSNQSPTGNDAAEREAFEHWANENRDYSILREPFMPAKYRVEAANNDLEIWQACTEIHRASLATGAYDSYRPHPDTSMQIRIDNALQRLNLDRPDIAALKDGETVSRNIADDRWLGTLLDDCGKSLSKANRVMDRMAEALKDIGVTAQLASMSSPEKFCEYAYNKSGDTLAEYDKHKKGGEHG